jgi:hypothetical protein
MFVMEKCCVFFEVGTEFFKYYLDELRLQRVKYVNQIVRIGPSTHVKEKHCKNKKKKTKNWCFYDLLKCEKSILHIQTLWSTVKTITFR